MPTNQNIMIASPSLGVRAALDNLLRNANLIINANDNTINSSTTANTNLPFGRQAFPMFDCITPSSAASARSLLRISYEAHLLSPTPTTPFPSLHTLSPLAATSPPLIASLLLESLSLLPSSLTALSPLYPPLVHHGTSLLSSPPDPIYIVSQLEQLLIQQLPKESAECITMLSEFRGMLPGETD